MDFVPHSGLERREKDPEMFIASSYMSPDVRLAFLTAVRQSAEIDQGPFISRFPPATARSQCGGGVHS